MNGNKKINNLKKLVVVISIAILIVAVVLVMSIYNNKFGGDSGAKGGRKSGTTANTEEVIFEEGKSDENIKINDKKNIVIKADSLTDNKTVKKDSNNNIVYKTNEDNNKYVKSTITGKNKDNNTVVEEKTLGEQEIIVSSYEEESVVISTTYIETLEPAVYTLTIFYKDENGNDKQVVFTFTVEEPWPEEETTTTTIVDPDGTTTTTKFVSSTKITKTRTIPPTSGTVIITQAPKNYTQITSGGSGYPNSEADVEWALFNAINKMRASKPLKMASELRSFAETNAAKAVSSFKLSIGNGCNSYNSSACRCDIDAGKYDNVSYCANTYKSVDHAAEQIINSNTGILDTDYEWIGIGVVYDVEGHYSWVVTVD